MKNRDSKGRFMKGHKPLKKELEKQSESMIRWHKKNKGTEKYEKIYNKVSEKNKVDLDLDKLKELYINQKLSPKEIAKIFCVSGKLIKNRLKEMKIKVRNLTRFKKGQHYSPKTEFKKGENHPCFNDWSSREPYGKKFSPKLKEKIRIRDNHFCQECWKKEEQVKTKLGIHHIDYNKQNNNPLNLISLCKKCHAKTNFDRKHWKRHFKNIMVLREIFNPENL